MIRNRFLHFTLAVATAYGALGCESGGVGDPCIPEEEYKQDFSGFALSEVNVESRSFQCETRVCIVNHFQGRVSCPYGQAAASIPETEPLNFSADEKGGRRPLTPASALYPDHELRCRVPGTRGDVQAFDPALGGERNLDAVTVPVDPQLIFRSASDSVYCSCRCNGPDPAARYCECPSGFVCEELVREIGVEGRGQLVGSYCIKPGTVYDPTHPPPPDFCDSTLDVDKEFPSGGKRRSLGGTCGQKDGNPANPPL